MAVEKITVNEDAIELLSKPEARGLLQAALREICRTRPEWWIAFLRREDRIQNGGRGWGLHGR